MTYQVLARKWRPRSFATLVGQEHVIKALSNALTNQRLHHAYLLTGTRGVGKTTIARILAKSLNCETGITAEPCGKCNACLQIDAGRFVDLLEIDAASNTGIDNIREVLDNAQYSPTQGRFKVYIIDEVHMLSKSAFNAMLKTLEEPPGHVKFILATTDPQKVPVTVLSRCLQFSLRQMLPQQITAHLAHVLKAEEIPFEAAALTMLGHAASGSMRDALSLLDQAIAYGSGCVEEAGVSAMLGAVDRSALYSLLHHVASKSGAELIEAAQGLASRGISADAALQEVASILHKVALSHNVPAALNADTPDLSAIQQLASAMSPEDVQLYYQISIQGRRDLALAPDEFAGMSMCLMRMLAFTPSNKQPYYATIPPQSSGPVNVIGVSASHRVDSAPATPDANTSQINIAKIDPIDTTPPSTEIVQHVFKPAIHPEQGSMPDNCFNGNWSDLVTAMKPGGQAGMLAMHARLASHEDDTFFLEVPHVHAAVADASYQARLEAELTKYLQRECKIRVAVGGNAETTPAAQQQQVKQNRLEAAERALNADGLVQSLISEFGATIVPGSIAPLDAAT